LAAGMPDPGQFQQSLQDAEITTEGSIESLDLAGYDMDALKAAVFDVSTEVARQ
jgi:hypothetical protein